MTTTKLDVKSVVSGIGAGIFAAASAYVLWRKLHEKQSEETPTPLKPGKKFEGEELENQKKLMIQHLERNIQFFGRENQDVIGRSYVIIVGVGSVGRYELSPSELKPDCIVIVSRPWRGLVLES
jgi:hypothetical protein